VSLTDRHPSTLRYTSTPADSEEAFVRDLFERAGKTGRDPDLHRYVASRLFGVSEEAVTEEQRRIAKALAYVRMYGSNASLP
jgi:hypothetical protein